MKKKIKVLISGANGLIGTFLCSYLRKKKIKYKKVDINNLNQNFKTFSHFLHLQFFISKNNKKKFKQKNISVIKKIIKICKKQKIILVFFSTSGADLKINDYTVSKKMCEKELADNSRKGELTSIILRIFNVYTPDLNSRGVIPELIKKMKKFKTINLKYYNNYRDFVYIDDLVILVKKIFNLKKSCKLEVGTGKATKIFDLAKHINSVFKFKNKIVKSKINKSSSNSFSQANVKNLINKIHWYPKIPIKKGLKKIYKVNR
tara:strand:+ start:1475 stop:2257 length:783 start_codon:yes stop_codon:yes gene_type:complete